MSAANPVPGAGGAGADLVFLWHMHQPDYRDHGTGEYRLPWVYLHAIKDYTDMAAHLERHPKIRCVVNFVPVLLDQIEDYADQFASGDFRDPLLALLARPDLDRLTADERSFLVESCFRCHHPTMLAPFPRYRRLHDLYALVRTFDGAGLDYLSGSYFADLVTWYHLAWTGESERRQRPAIAALMTRGEDFMAADRQTLVAELGAVVASIVPRYRALAARGQIELSATPATHPLAPLLLDFASAREAVPDLQLPEASHYEGGRSRVVAQVRDAQASHRERFGEAPRGMWPAEGAVSLPLLRLLADHGVGWTATGAGVLRNSAGASTVYPYRPQRIADVTGTAVLFRDETLSDLIGFEYAKWHGRDAAADFVARVDAIGRAAPAGERPLVTVALDGENAWEYYPYNGWYFFDDLYAQIEKSAAISPRTCSEALADPGRRWGHLPRLVAGSWVYGTFTTWIGDPDKNRAWDLLCAAKQSYDLVASSGRLDAETAALAERQLAVCESSDWFWWLGGYNSPQSVATFEQLFRRNLSTLYGLLGLTPPPTLTHPIGEGHGTPESGGAMRRATVEDTEL